MFSREGTRHVLSLIPVLHVAVTVSSLIAGSAAFWCRYLLPVVPSMIILSARGLERIRRQDASLFNFVLLSHIAFNCLFLLMRLYH
jgi:hypothetical protein